MRCKKMNLVIFPDELAAKMALAKRVWKDKGERRYFFCDGHYHLSRHQLR